MNTVDYMFSGYGDREEPRSPIVCEENFGIEYIEKLASIEFENFKNPEFVFLSENLYKKLVRDFATKQRFSIGSNPTSMTTIAMINTCAGQLKIKQIHNMDNFCYVGSETSWEHIEWVRVSMEFEKVFLGKNEDV